MNDLHDELQPIDAFKAFQNGRREAFRCFFRQHHYRIYCYLFRETRNRVRSQELTKYCFVVLFRNYTIVKDEDHMLRILYLLARMSLVLQLREPDGPEMLEEEWRISGLDDDGIMDDPDVMKNEILIAVQRALRNLSLRRTS
jgi:DNA-directed RNA polymerase specialized sigma24 family protein